MPHIHEKIDFTATAFIVYNNKVLLRMHDKYKLWLGTGGHIELDENPNQTLIREVKEEVGLDVNFNDHKLTHTIYDNGQPVQELVPPDYMNMHEINDTHKHMDMIYLIKAASDHVVAGGDDKSDQWKWLTKEELRDPQYKLNDVIIKYCEKALEKFKE